MSSAGCEWIAAAYSALGRSDAVMSDLIRNLGTPDPFAFPDGGRTTGNHFAGMVLHIVAQQISIKVALVLYDRLTTALGETPTPAGVLGRDLDQLRALGLSHSKAAYLHHLADAVVSGDLAIDALDESADDEVINALTRVKGIGPWSAEMFLIHQLQRSDILPAGDFGIRTAVQRAYALTDLPPIADVRQRGISWSPFRTLASTLLWRSLHAVGPGDSPRDLNG